MENGFSVRLKFIEFNVIENLNKIQNFILKQRGEQIKEDYEILEKV